MLGPDKKIKVLTHIRKQQSNKRTEYNIKGAFDLWKQYTFDNLDERKPERHFKPPKAAIQAVQKPTIKED